MNPDFEGFIEKQLKKIYVMTYSIVGVRIVKPPYKTVYAPGDDVWVPADPDNPKNGIEAAVQIGGGTEYPYYFERFDAAQSVLTMKSADGKILCFRVEGFNTDNLTARAALTLTALDADGKDLAIPVLPEEYRWKFEHEGETLVSFLEYEVTGAAFVRAVGGGGVFYAGIQEALDALAADGGGRRSVFVMSDAVITENPAAIGEERPIVVPNGLDVVINGAEAGERVIRRGAGFTGALFTVPEGAALTFGGGGGKLALDGGNGFKAAAPAVNNSFTADGAAVGGGAADSGPLVKIESGGVFTLKDGAALRNNKNTGAGGAIQNFGIFTMNGGSIYGNSASLGGGIYNNGGNFAMSGGVISGNAAPLGSGVYNFKNPLSMKGYAVIAADNDVYICAGAGIKVEGELFAPNMVVITPADYTSASVLIDVSLLNGASAASVLERFALTPSTDGETYTLTLDDANRGKIRKLEKFSLVSTIVGSGGVDVNYSDFKSAVEALYTQGVVTEPKDALLGGTASLPKDITLKPADGNDVKLTASFTLAGNGNLILSGGANGETLTLTPANANLEAVTVNSGAILTLKNGAVISGETNVAEKRSVSLVKINSGGEFVMTGGELSGNKISTSGGAVYIDGGKFTMTDGSIHDNEGVDGGGVYLRNGTFTMEGGFIENNTGTTNGGGVNIGSDSGAAGLQFYFSGGAIRNNTVTGSGYGGGGVTVTNSGVFYMSGNAEIYGNSSKYGSGGGVSVQSAESKFFMSSGVIRGNTANRGGGVHMSSGTFEKTGGMVYGDDDVDDGLKNKADQGGSSFYKNNNGSATNNGAALSTTNSTF